MSLAHHVTSPIPKGVPDSIAVFLPYDHVNIETMGAIGLDGIVILIVTDHHGSSLLHNSGLVFELRLLEVTLKLHCQGNGPQECQRFIQVVQAIPLVTLFANFGHKQNGFL